MKVLRDTNRFLLLVTAPFIGAIFSLLFWIQWEVDLSNQVSLPNVEVDFQQQTEDIVLGLKEAITNVAYTQVIISEVYDNYIKSANKAIAMAQIAETLKTQPLIIYDRRVTAKLGTPIETIRSDNIEIDVFQIKETNYQGYAMKVNLKSPDAMKLVLGNDTLGEAETTLSAVNRYGAVAGINAGGFADDAKTGKRYPLSTTMIDENYLFGFQPSFSDLFFVGLDDQGKLIGGEFSKQEDLDKLNPQFGVSFVPILLKDGESQTIPEKWKTSPTRAARTIIANYKHDHLLFLVINGNDGNGSYGATLAELQEKLKQLGAVDAYNLDGGGSTSLVINGEVWNHPSDGKLRPLATHFLFFK